MKRRILAITPVMLLVQHVEAFAPGCPRQRSGSVKERWNVHRSVPFISHVAPIPGRFVTPLFASIDDSSNVAPSSSVSNNDEDDDVMDDTTLLATVALDQLQDLCEQASLEFDKTNDTKEILLKRLRDFASEQAETDRLRRNKQKARIERGADDDRQKAKHQIVGDALEDDDANLVDEEFQQGVFYFSLPSNNNTNSNATVAQAKSLQLDEAIAKRPITVPRVPPKKNEQGERVVTVYSSTDQNDLTSVSSHQSVGQQAAENSMSDAMMGGFGGKKNPEEGLVGGPFGDTSGSVRRKESTKELEEASEVVRDLVMSLLAMTGAPGFQDEFNDGLVPLSEKDQRPAAQSQFGFVGFDASRVPTELLNEASSPIRAGNGDVLRDVLSEMDIQAIGHDGLNGDDVEQGGGHYREVQKVAAFLEGYRQAEVRKMSRETASLLLDRLVTEGVNGLDFMLATMTKGDDGTSSAGELNDSLIQFLNDAIRQQEQKVEKLAAAAAAASAGRETTKEIILQDEEEDRTKSLWNVTTDFGDTIETLDPNDPEVQRVLKEEAERENKALSVAGAASEQDHPRNRPPAEQLLILLTLLRERIKAEAAFSNDEKGRNLRVLAYCMHAVNNQDRETIILDSLGASLDRLDSFAELVASSIEYAESATHLLQPSKSRPLDLNLLKSIASLVEDLKEQQAWRASGISAREADSASWQ